MVGAAVFLRKELGLVGWTLSQASTRNRRVEVRMGDQVVSWAYAATSWSSRRVHQQAHLGEAMHGVAARSAQVDLSLVAC